MQGVTQGEGGYIRREVRRLFVTAGDLNVFIHGWIENAVLEAR